MPGPLSCPSKVGLRIDGQKTSKSCFSKLNIQALFSTVKRTLMLKRSPAPEAFAAELDWLCLEAGQQIVVLRFLSCIAQS